MSKNKYRKNEWRGKKPKKKIDVYTIQLWKDVGRDILS